jgi:hypothetical protein
VRRYADESDYSREVLETFDRFRQRAAQNYLVSLPTRELFKPISIGFERPSRRGTTLE